MRLDHIAYRVRDREKTARFFIDAFGYRLQDKFRLPFDDGTFADCISLEPPERIAGNLPWLTSLWHVPYTSAILQQPSSISRNVRIDYHLPPEIFVSDGTPGSIVGDWVAARGGVGGIHHIAYQVEDVALIMRVWRANGYAEFSTDAPLQCPGLTQVFTKPSELTGVVYEFIKREGAGFCKENVKALMQSTKNDGHLPLPVDGV